MGVCHFRADMSPPIDQFLRNWKCVGSARGASMLVIGDSHAADKAAAFKLNGVDVAQMTGAGCSAAPSQMSPDCRRIFELVKEYSVAHPFRTLIIANKQFPTGYTSAEIDEAVAFWRPLNARILWFSDMPQFADLEDRKARNLLATGSAAQGIFPSTLKDAKANFESMRGVARGRFLAIDSARLYCFISAPEDCRPFIEGQGWAALPEGHLTAIGAYLFGRQMLADPAFNL
jgi:hypothetical protein